MRNLPDCVSLNEGQAHAGCRSNCMRLMDDELVSNGSDLKTVAGESNEACTICQLAFDATKVHFVRPHFQRQPFVGQSPTKTHDLEGYRNDVNCLLGIVSN
jgi:hypothetical protein